MGQTEYRYERPPLYAKQQAFVDDPNRYSVTEASTKTGKTIGCVVWIHEMALGVHPWCQRLSIPKDANFWWIAPVSTQSGMAFRRLKSYLAGVPGLIESNESERYIRYRHGNRIWFKSGEVPDNLYGEDVYGAVIDEATRLREESWTAIRTTLSATRAPVKIIGNVKGRKNWAYRMARDAQSETLPDMGYHKITAYDAVDAGIMPLEEVEDAKRVLPQRAFQELFLAEPSDDGGNPFGLQHILDCVDTLSDGVPVCWGWDLAKSVDWTVGVALDSKGRVCRVERWQAAWRATIRDIVTMTKDVRAYVDATGVGDPILEELQHQSNGNFEGFKFSSTSKQQLMEGLAVAIQNHEITYPDGIIRSELEMYEYEYSRMGVRYSAPEGMHDDAVCALALAVAMYRTEHRYGDLSGLAAAYGIPYGEISRADESY